MCTASGHDAYLDQLIQEDEARLLANNRFCRLTDAERREQLYTPAVKRFSSQRSTAAVAGQPKPSTLRVLSRYAVEGLAHEQVEGELMREYQLVKEEEGARRAAAESGYSGHRTQHRGQAPSAVAQWQKFNEAESYRRDLYQSTRLHASPPQRALAAASQGGHSDNSAIPAIDRTQTISNSQIVGPYLTLHSIGRYSRYEALQQRHPIHHSGNTPKAGAHTATSTKAQEDTKEIQ